MGEEEESPGCLYSRIGQGRDIVPFFRFFLGADPSGQAPHDAFGTAP